MGRWEPSIAENSKGNFHSDSISSIAVLNSSSFSEKIFSMLFPQYFCDKFTHLDNDATNYRFAMPVISLIV